MSNIDLQNGRTATLCKVKELKDKKVYIYDVPCPLCGQPVRCHSYDMKYFDNVQVNCRHCGIFFKPIVKRR